METTLILEVLGWSILSVSNAEKVFQLSQVDLKEELGSVRLLAAMIHILLSENSLEKMDMFKSQETGLMFLSIALLWNNILDEVWKSGNTYTTEMRLSLTTGLKILNSLISGIIPENIIRDAKKENGVWLHVNVVERNSSDTQIFSINTPKLFADENVLMSIMPAILNTLAKIAEENSIPLSVGEESFVQPNVQTDRQAKKERTENSVPVKNVAQFLKLFPVEIQNIVEENVCRLPIEKGITPNMELITLARKPLSEPTIAANVLKWGTGALNIDGCRIETSSEDQEQMKRVVGFNKSYSNGEPSMSLCGGVDGSLHKRDRSEFDGSKGRWPPNVATDGSDEVLALFPETKSGILAQHHVRKGKSQIGTFDIRDRTGEPIQTFGDEGSAARFFYCAKAGGWIV